MPAPVTTELVWSEIEKRSFAILSYVTPKGHPRSAGILYVVQDRTLYIGTKRDSWKSKYIAQNPHVALNVTIPKRIPLMPWVQIPDATIAFPGEARLLPAAETDRGILQRLLRGMVDDPELLETTEIIEVKATGHFVTYGVGVSLLEMRDPKKARGRVPC